MDSLYKDVETPDTIGVIKDFKNVEWYKSVLSKYVENRVNGKSMYDWFGIWISRFRRVMFVFVRMMECIVIQDLLEQPISISRLDLWTDLQYKIKDNEDFFVTENGQIRIYDKDEKLFPKIIQIFRLD